MKITFVLPEFTDKPAGGYRVIFEYANFFSAKGHDVTIVFPRNPSKLISLPPQAIIKRFIWPLKMLASRPKTNSWMPIDPRVQFCFTPFLPFLIPDSDAVVATAWQTAEHVAKLPSKKGRKFYLVQDHEVWFDADEERVNATFRLGLSTIVISKWLARIVLASGGTAPIFIPNGLDHATFHTTDDPVARPPAILALNHLSPRKDRLTALRALAIVKDRFPELAVSMFGIPNRDSAIPEWIKYHQTPDPNGLRKLYNEHSIFLSSSLLEGWCLPAAEAMACGCALISTDSKGPREFASDPENAIFSQPKDFNALASSLETVIIRPALRKQMQLSAIASMRRFTWESSGSRMLDALGSKAL